MQITEHLGLQKPEPNETFDIEVQNTNMDLIDDAIKDIDEYIVVNKSDIAKLLERYNTETDWVVEQKTSGVWTYRKWNSGLAECWGKAKSGTYTASSAWGSGKYMNLGTVSFPSGLFTTITKINADVEKPSGSGMPFFSLYAVSKTGFNGYIQDPNANATGYAYNLYIDAKGRWK